MDNRRNKTVYQRLNMLFGPNGVKTPEKVVNNKYNLGSDVLIKTQDKAEYELAKKQMEFIPGVFCADFKTLELAEKFIENTKIFGEKCSFGSPDSRVEIPAKISHASFSKEELAAIGIAEGTVRFSIGLESVEDLIEDIKQAVK